MQKKYKYEKCKEFVPMQNKGSYFAGFSFSEIPEVVKGQPAKEVTEITIKIEITDQAKENWQVWQQSNAKSDDDLIKVLSGIAKEDGLKKGIKLIKVNGDAYPEGIGKFEEYGMEEGCEFMI